MNKVGLRLNEYSTALLHSTPLSLSARTLTNLLLPVCSLLLVSALTCRTPRTSQG